MRKLISILFFIFLMAPAVFSQTPPNGINYQAVARDANGVILMNQEIEVTFHLLPGPTDSPEYTESHSLQTNEFGLFTAIIGEGDPTTGQFADIVWASSQYYLQVEVDGQAIGQPMPFVSVPYAFRARTVQFDADTQKLFTNTNQDSIFITNGNGVAFPPSAGDNQNLTLDTSKDSLFITNGTGVDVKTYRQQINVNSTNQNDSLWLTGQTSGISIVDDVDDADPDPGNELQTLSISNDTIYLENGGFVKLPPAANDTDWAFNGADLHNLNSGNVGIGISSPTSNLHINSSTASARLRITNTATGNTANDGFFVGNSSSAAWVWQQEAQPLIFATNNSERVRISDAGRVGIGAANPQNLLDVNGATAIGATYAGNLSAPTDGLIVEGHVGIGSSNPAEDLEVRADNVTIRVQSNLNNSFAQSKIEFGNTISSVFTQHGWVGVPGSGDYLEVGSPNFIEFITNFNTRMRIDNNGNVGIGTLTPSELLHVENATANSAMLIESGSGNARLKLDGTTGNHVVEFYESNSKQAELGWASGGNYLYLYENSTTSLVSRGGNIGIGTTTPSTKFDLVGDFQLVDGTQGAGKFLMSDALGNTSWQRVSQHTAITPPGCQSLGTVATTYLKISDLGTFTKNDLNSIIELTFMTHVSVASFSASNGVVFELRIDDLPTSIGNIRAHYSANTVGQYIPINMSGVFEGLTVGNHTVSLWVRTLSGTATNIFYDPGCWGASSVLVNETY